jgi:hypothetical protein
MVVMDEMQQRVVDAEERAAYADERVADAAGLRQRVVYAENRAAYAEQRVANADERLERAADAEERVAARDKALVAITLEVRL